MNKNSSIYVPGHNGLVGSAITRELNKQGYQKLILRNSKRLNLLDQTATYDFFNLLKPEYVFMCAARVGGIMDSSTNPAEFIYQNLQIQCNIINAAYKYKVKKLLFLGSSCIYPRMAKQPITEDQLLSSSLEPTNESYAIAKIAGLKMCQAYNKQYGTNFISCMPTNLYGLNDNYDINNSHVFPALIRKFHEAKNKDITLWGSGKPKREFLYVEDLAEACVFLMQNYNSSEIINIGTGEDISIHDLALLVKDVVGFKGKIFWDESKPDGMPRKLLDVSKINRLGWKHKTHIKDGIKKSYKFYLDTL